MCVFHIIARQPPVRLFVWPFVDTETAYNRRMKWSALRVLNSFDMTGYFRNTKNGIRHCEVYVFISLAERIQPE